VFARSKDPRLRYVLIGLAVGLVALVALIVLRRGDDPEKLTLDEFQDRIDQGEVETAELRDRDSEVTGELSDGTEYTVAYPTEFGDELTTLLTEAEPPVELEVDQQNESLWTALLLTYGPLLLIFGAIFYLISTMQGGRGASRFGRAKAREFDKDQPQVTFDDVAGADEAVEELEEIKDFLAEPTRFRAMGAKIPKGVLLYGPPGTGKTLLARAVAGEAGAPFFSISGSDFVEMFVGVGASRVRNLFEQAKKSAPAIVFVDEIDAVGRHRGAGLGGGHDEREQTLNQLLVEMDGFDVSSGVILVAATNRPDILDPALLRPGRFDRQIVVDKPDLDVLARRTPGFTGADLANLLNEAALLSARRGTEAISMQVLGDAVDRVLAGPERKTRVMSDDEKRRIAYHEGGHALVGHALHHTDPIHKVSIIARGRALGWTLALPEQDRYLQTQAELEDTLTMLLGGRAAEELVFDDTTTGAADDIEKATAMARAMVTEFGMSDAVGPRQLGHTNGEVFLGKEVGHEPNYSEEVATLIDTEVRALLDRAHSRAVGVLTDHRAVLDRLAGELVDHETLDEPHLNAIFADLTATTTGTTEAERT
jgi:cell division protease FtsH